MKILEIKWMSLMKKQNLILFSFFILIFINISNSQSEDLDIGSEISNLDRKYFFVRVLDGDTIKMGFTKIRFFGIDSPESKYRGKKQICFDKKNKKIYCAELSKRMLEKIISENIKKKGSLKCVIRDKPSWDREVGECFINVESKFKSLSKFMVRNGYAFDFPKYSKGEYYLDQKYAENNSLGIWKYEFVYPWEWRDNIKQKNNNPKFTKFTVKFNE